MLKIFFFICAFLPFWGNALEKEKDVLTVAREYSLNVLDVQNPNASQGSRTVAWNAYDRLLNVGKIKLPNGHWYNDTDNVKPGLAESWEYDKDGTSLIFHLKKDATFHDGSPVTAHDVKWSLDRAVTVGGPKGFSAVQMSAGGLKDPSQFIVIDDHTFKIALKQKNKMALADLAVPLPIIFNSKLAKTHATKDDPWAIEWLSMNVAGGGAYKVESFIPGLEIVYTRYEDWKLGPKPKLKKIIERSVPSSQFRKSMLLNKEVDFIFEVPTDLIKILEKSNDIVVIDDAVKNSMFYLDMNVKFKPFNNIKVRQAIAYAIPYDEIFNQVAGRKGIKLYDGKNLIAQNISWPQPFPYYTDLIKAKQLLMEVGLSEGFDADLFIDLGSSTFTEPSALLIQKNLKKININITIKKVLDVDWREKFSKKEMPMLINNFSGWLDLPEYFFFWNYHGQNAIFNTMSYQNIEMDKLINDSIIPRDKKGYEEDIKNMITKAFQDIPRIPLFQMYLAAAMQKNVKGYYYVFRVLDYREMYKE